MKTRKSRFGLDTSRTNESETHRKGNRFVIILIATLTITIYPLIPAQEAKSIQCSHEAKVYMRIKSPYLNNWQTVFEIKRAKYCCEKKEYTGGGTYWVRNARKVCKYCGPNDYRLVMTNFVHQVLRDNPVGQNYVQWCIQNNTTTIEGYVVICCGACLPPNKISESFIATIQEHTVHVRCVTFAGGEY